MELTVRGLLAEARDLLPAGEYDNPSLDALVLLAWSLGMSKEALYARLTDPVDPAAADEYLGLVRRRAAGEPVAYITGRKEFYGLEFAVGPGVLIPRPDTEILVEWVLESHDADRALDLHDCCSGSGAIAGAIAARRPKWKVSASDISEDAGRIFRANWARLISPADPSPWLKSDLLESLAAGSQDIITANPPYLTADECDQKDIEGWREPRLALDGGSDGLDLIRRLIRQAFGVLRTGGSVYIEAADAQADTVCRELVNGGFIQAEVREDLGKRRRVSRAVRP
jgi:release factor glutamine methyltransferase